MSMKHAQWASLGDTTVTAPRPANAVAFFRVSKKSPLLPLNAADCAFSNFRMEKEGEHHCKSSPQREVLPVHRNGVAPNTTLSVWSWSKH